MSKYRRVTGMRDVLFDDQPYWRFILNKIQETTDLFGYRRIDTPLLEQASLFIRGVGEGTDIVEKEMYIFEDRDGDATGPAPRIYRWNHASLHVENGMHTLPSPAAGMDHRPPFSTRTPPGWPLSAAQLNLILR